MSAVVLHRFPISNFSEKARALLEYKRIDYDVREHLCGLPQWELVRLSGQRKVPVIEHAGRVVHDSTAIAHYLDRAFPDRPRVVPEDEPRRAQVLALEEEIDEVLGVGAPILWFEDVVRGRRLDEVELLATEVHGLSSSRARWLGRGVRRARALGVGSHFVRSHSERARALLARLSKRVEHAPFLIGREPTLADIAAVGLTLHLDWPSSPRLHPAIPAGRAITSLVEAPDLRRFFEWRRAFYARHLG